MHSNKLKEGLAIERGRDRKLGGRERHRERREIGERERHREERDG